MNDIEVSIVRTVISKWMILWKIRTKIFLCDWLTIFGGPLKDSFVLDVEDDYWILHVNKPVELVTDNLIMSLDGLHNFNSPRKIDHPKCNILANDTVVLDIRFQNYLQESLLEDVICENYSSCSSESIKSTYTVSRYLKEPPSVLNILFQRVIYYTTTYEAIKNELKVAIPLEYL